jgi:tight adherence protein C
MELLGKIGLVTDIPILIAGFAFFAMVLLFIGLRQLALRRSRRRELIKKIQRIEGPTRAGTQASLDSEDATRKTLLNFLIGVGKRLASEKSTDYSSSKMIFLRAGLRGEHVQAAFWGAKTTLAVAPPLVFILLRVTVFKVMSPLLTLYICLLLAFLGFYLPNLWLRNRISRRKVAIFKGLPDAIDLLVVCVEAGMGLNAAINHVAQELSLAHPVLSDEFNLFTLEMRTGKLRKDALRSLALRTGLEEMDSFATMLIQTEKFGSSVGRTLRVFSDSFRTKRFQKAEEIAAKLPVKLTFPCILFIFPALFAVIAGPAAIRVYETLINR